MDTTQPGYPSSAPPTGPAEGVHPDVARLQDTVDAFLGPGKAHVTYVPPTPSIPQSVTYQQITDALAILGLDASLVTALSMRAQGFQGHAIHVDLHRVPGHPKHVRGVATIRIEGRPAREPSLHTQWAALEADGSWTSGADETRAEAAEIVAARPETTLARRWVGRWEKP